MIVGNSTVYYTEPYIIQRRHYSTNSSALPDDGTAVNSSFSWLCEISAYEKKSVFMVEKKETMYLLYA